LWWGKHSEKKAIGQLRAHKAVLSHVHIGPEWVGELVRERFDYIRYRVWTAHVSDLSAAQLEGIDLESLKHLEGLILYHCELDDHNIARLGELETLDVLGLHSTLHEKLNLTPITKLTRLYGLSLWGLAVDDADLQQICGLHRITSLDLGSTDITDNGLRHLQSLSALEDLGLANTAITDAGLEQLKNLRSLRLLDVRGTRATAAGVERLKKSLVNLRVAEDGAVLGSAPDPMRQSPGFR